MVDGIDEDSLYGGDSIEIVDLAKVLETLKIEKEWLKTVDLGESPTASRANIAMMKVAPDEATHFQRAENIVKDIQAVHYYKMVPNVYGNKTKG